MSERRRQDVLRRVQESGRVGLGDLAAAAGVSEMTVRRDLDDLTRRGLLHRVRGGAVSLQAAGSPGDSTGDSTGDSPAGSPGGAEPAPLPSTAPGDPRRAHRPPAALAPVGPGAGRARSGGPAVLLRAGRAVAEAVLPGTTVLLDAGPGAVEVATHLARSATPEAPVTVAVTGLEAAVVLAGSPGVRLVVLGGEPRPGEPGLLGPAALAALGDLHLDLVVLTPAGLHPATGCWARSPDAAALARTALARTDRAVALAGLPVLGRRSLVRTAPLAALDQVVVPAEDAAAPVLVELRGGGVDVVLA